MKPMTTREAVLQPIAGSGSRIGIIAGGGNLPVAVAEGIARQGLVPFVILIEGEYDPGADLDRFDHETLALEELGSLMAVLKRHAITHLVLAGEIKRRPRLMAMRFNLGFFKIAGLVAMALARGDDGLLKVLVNGLEARGIKVVGAHEIVPDLLASEGQLSKAAPQKSDWNDILAARAAAEAIGALDIGQAAVAIGGRAIALEGVEGTDGLLERVKGLRGHGRIAGKRRGVLVKCAKPQQEVRADLPSVGLQTVEGAHVAGLAGIAVEAGRSLILDGPQMIARANELGLFVLGLPARGVDHDG